MDLNPPEGSKIRISSDRSDPTIIVPQAGGASRYFVGLFLLFWLGLWTVGFKSAASALMSGKASAFLLFWLGGWTLGGVYAIYMAYRAFRPSVPETLELRSNSVAYDSGVAPPQFDMYARRGNVKGAWNSTFPKRVRVELERRQLQSLRLRETESSNRLTVDVEAKRIEIAPAASEVEREWLARLLARRYSLPQVLGNTSSTSA